ncbi:SseB family protein [Mycolicibacterium diernhoferi]|uniref:SseB protein N-terminal domain-containing protein n=1 Tax=Mycolicibacterium diernhoferi TaxID=1801 RepID=A0A1Q4H7J9_9MYCO|nr:SseB family protein [Mycolicibacterium diernhoferi]OJZ63487.1 hypothetical protein BRW64_21890 [Mycolicibacterium diernhoferi]OPE56273.1 hypothetical protein BV510_00605 [Mycolicibacterium diernhoferi]PEG55503.1 hypothetical protein CRI78_06225 [Mycolicibacterium diernhoferi]QYL24420.1 SseB family protein [Mycolicibacterium diernhoferi]
MTLVDNTTMRRAVAAFAADPGQRLAFDVLRECMNGEVLLDITGSDDPVYWSFPGGSRVQIRSGTGPDGNRALFVFTRNEEVARMHPPGTRTQSMATPATGALELAHSLGSGWLYIDPAGPTCALSAQEIEFALRNPHNEQLKATIAEWHAGRADRHRVLEVLREKGPLLLAVDTTVPGKTTAATIAMSDGTTALLAFTSAPEVVAYNPAKAVMALTTTQIIDVVRTNGYSGLVVNQAGPSIAVPHSALS